MGAEEEKKSLTTQCGAFWAGCLGTEEGDNNSDSWNIICDNREQQLTVCTNDMMMTRLVMTKTVIVLIFHSRNWTTLTVIVIACSLIVKSVITVVGNAVTAQ